MKKKIIKIGAWSIGVFVVVCLALMLICDQIVVNNAAPKAPPITPVGTKPVLPSWSNLTKAQKQLLSDSYGIENFEDYNELLNDPATVEGIYQDLRCKGLI